MFISKNPSFTQKSRGHWFRCFFGSGEDSWLSFFFWGLFIFLMRTVLFCPYKIPSGSMIPTLLVGDHILVSRFPYGFCRFSLLGSQYFDYFSGRIFAQILPSRGDVVVFTCPTNFSMDYVKRCVGLPGDKVQMVGGLLHINGKQLEVKKVEENYVQHDGYKVVKGDVYEETFPVASLDATEKVIESGKVFKHSILKIEPFGESSTDSTPVFEVPKEHFFFVGDNRDGSSDSRESLGFVHKDFLLGPAKWIFWSVNENIIWWKPWTWFTLLQDARWNRLGNKIK